MDQQRYRRTPFGQAKRTPGRHGYVAFQPAPIPREVPLTPETVVLLADAEAALGRLAGAGRLLPNPHLLVRPFLRREALASTRIEGTHASLPELLEVEAFESPPTPDIEEVVNYIKAMEQALARADTLPLSSRLIREAHAALLAGVRGQERDPGRFRTSQNWIGPHGATIETATFVPPPHLDVPDLIADWERFSHESPTRMPLLAQCALLHYQFETIHPFLDGNGRLGRLLIVFFLVQRGRLPNPILYLSPYFETHRDQYYERLQAVRELGDVDGWLQFFLTAVSHQAVDALTRAERLVDLREDYRRRVLSSTRSQAAHLVDLAFDVPFLTARLVENRLGVTRQTSTNLLVQLTKLGIFEEEQSGPRGQRRWQAPEIVTLIVKNSL